MDTGDNILKTKLVISFTYEKNVSQKITYDY